MEISKNSLSDSVMELTVTAETKDVEKYLEQAATNLSKEIKLAGFRAGKVPYEVMKQRVGEMVIWEEAAKLLISKTTRDLVLEHCPREAVGWPAVEIVKLAPGNSLEYKLKVEMWPEIKLGDYKNLGLEQAESTVSETEVDKVLNELAEAQASEAAVERPAALGDKVLLNIKMFLDKVPVEGGQSQGAAVILGKHYVVPGFDDKIVSAKAGDMREFDLIYPSDHYQKNLAGKRVEFVVEIKEILERTLPSAEELAKRFGLPQADALKKNIRDSLTQEKNIHERDKVFLTMMNKIIDSSQVSELAPGLIAEELETMLAELKHNVEAHGGKFDDYLLHIKKSPADLKADWQEDATKRLKSALLLRTIAAAENIKPSEADIDHELGHLAEHYMQDEKALSVIRSAAYRQRVAIDLTNRQALNQLAEWNIKGYTPEQHHHH